MQTSLAALLLFPLIGAALQAVLGRRLGPTKSGLLACVAIAGALVAAGAALWHQGVASETVSFGSWISLDGFRADFSLLYNRIAGLMALALLLFGIALVYAGSGRLDIAASLAADGPIVVAGLGLILVGLGFKLSLAPVHLWTPDVYQGAPAPVAAFLSTGSKAATAMGLIASR